MAGVLLVAGLFACYPVQAMADPASGQDQYLEVVPGGGGDQSPKGFSKSLGGNGGPVSKQQVIALAKRNAERRVSRGGKAGGNSIADSPRQAAPSDAAAVVTAAAKQPFSRTFTLILVALLLLTVGGGLWLRMHKTA